jgi:hypothetical protein
MRTCVIVCLLTLGALLAACKGGGSAGGYPVGDLTDEEAIRAWDELATQLAEDGDYRAVYDFLAPEYRQQCAYERYERSARLGSEIESLLRSHERDGEIVRIEVDGDRATVVSLDYSPARDELDEETTEVVKIDGRWFVAPDDEGIAFCKSDMFASDATTAVTMALWDLGLRLPGARESASTLQALFEKSFSEHFQQACQFEAFAGGVAAMHSAFAGTFDAPDQWKFQMAKDYAWVTTAAGDPVAKLAKGGADWKLDSIAGYEECA